MTLCLIVLLCILFTACSASGNDGGATATPPAQSTIVHNEINRKFTYEVRIDLTVDSVSQTKTTLTQKNTELGGYLERNEEDYSDGECTSAYVVFRVPTEQLDTFIAVMESGGGKVSDKRVFSTDITTSYVNATAKKTALETKKAALQALLADATLSASDKVSVISEIAAVDTELQAIELTINEYDSLVDYSTVSVNIQLPAPFMSVFMPFFILLGVPAIVLATVFGVLRMRKKRRAKLTQNN